MKHLKQNIWVVIYSFVITLFVWIFAISAQNEDIIYRLLTNVAYFLVISCSLLITQGTIRNVFASLLFFLTLVPNIVVQSYVLMDNIVMKSTDFWVIFNTNPSEAGGLIDELPTEVFYWDGLYICIAIFLLICLIRKNEHKCVAWWIQLLGVFLWLGCQFILPFRAKVQSIDFYKSYYKYNKEKIEVKEFFANRKDLVIDSKCFYPQEKKTIVVVIGESQNRNHMQLYGYPRETNPKLMEIRDELVVYNDVTSPDIMTLNCMKTFLTFANHENPDMYKKEASIIEILRDAGWKTYWIDNQGSNNNGMFAIDAYTPTSYRTIAGMCDVFNESLCGKNDSTILPYYFSCLTDSAENKVIFLHLIGNHFDYKGKYEHSYEYFNGDANIVSKVHNRLTNDDIEIINQYDNATRYNDYIIRTIIDSLRQQEGICAMLYFSDHGEEVFDTQYYYKRSFDKISYGMCEVPLILWGNDAFIYGTNLVYDENRPFCTDDVIYVIMDITQTYYKYDSLASIISKAYLPKERYIHYLRYEDIK